MAVETCGVTPEGQDIHRVTLEGHGLRASLLTLGAVLERLEAPDRDGAMANVTLGLERPEDYARRGQPYFGSVVGRFANRIAGARFVLDGREHRLAANEGPTCLHGGPDGFAFRVWEVVRASATEVVLALNSPDGDQGFPGAMRATARWALEAGATLSLSLEAEADAPTVVNLTHHGYWNLRGEGEPGGWEQELRIAADAFLPVDAALIPTSDLRLVAGTPFDFRAATAVGARIGAEDAQLLVAGGYDHCWVLGGAPRAPRPVAWLRDPASGREMVLETDRPGLQLYAAQHFDGRFRGPSGRPYGRGAGLALEPQGFPDAPNQPGFPSAVLRPGERHKAVTRWRFSAPAPRSLLDPPQDG